MTSSVDAATTATPFTHIVIIMQENHSFDNYFGTYPGLPQGNVCGGHTCGIPPGTCLPDNFSNPKGPCTAPFSQSSVLIPDIPHEGPQCLNDLDGNSPQMNGFAAVQGNESMGYYNGTTIPNYWAYAENYALADMAFGSACTWSLPNAWMLYAAGTPACIESTPECLTTELNTYENEANALPTIAGELLAAGMTWKVYNTNVTWNDPSQILCCYQGSPLNESIAYWNPGLSQSRTYTSAYLPHYVNRTQIFQDITSGALPQVSLVRPGPYDSEHPGPYGTITEGMDWVTSVVNAIMSSKYWKNTLIVITYDEWGGFYDNVPPPIYEGTRLGPRVPMLFISAYSKPGFVDSTVYQGGLSILRFIEYNWHLKPINKLDANANNILNSFNFSQPLNKPLILPDNYPSPSNLPIPTDANYDPS